MSKKRYNDDCAGCKPALIDPATGQVVPEDDPIMKKVLAVYWASTREEREAFHRFCCLNSRAQSDLGLVNGFKVRLESAFITEATKGE